MALHMGSVSYSAGSVYASLHTGLSIDNPLCSVFLGTVGSTSVDRYISDWRMAAVAAIVRLQCGVFPPGLKQQHSVEELA